LTTGEISKNSSKLWYDHPMVRWNMILACWDREVSVQGKRRKTGKEFHRKSMTMTSVPYAERVLCNRRDEITDAYTSLSVYDNQPILSVPYQIKQKFFAETKPLYWITAFDFDSPDLLGATESMINALEWIAGMLPHLKYSIKFSGGKGWHIETSQRLPYERGMENNAILAGALEISGKSPCIDTVIYCPRREWRIPWSLHHKGMVSMPFLPREVTDFLKRYPRSLKDLQPKKLIKKYPIKNQGYKWFTATPELRKEIEKIKELLK